MGTALVTVAIVPRERFSYAKTSLDNILATTTGDYELVYVDGNSPPDVREHIAEQAQTHGFRVVRRDHYLSPNQARNLAAQHARTPYIVFIDNDVIVSPGWLQALVDCAEQTGAWVVGPIYCEGLPAGKKIHMAGGEARFVVRDGRRVFEEDHRYFGQPLAEVQPKLVREPVEQIEFHCALVRREAFDRLGPLDEGLWSAAEHSDLCLAVRKAGAKVYLEPSSVVTYVPPSSFTKADRDFFMLRWSHAWNTATIEHFRAKWRLEADDPGLAFLAQWCEKHRRLAWAGVTRAARMLGGTPGKWLQNKVINPLEQSINRRRHPGVLAHRAKARGVPAPKGHAEFPCAQTNLQLYNQLLAQGRTDDELRLARDAYELAMRLFAGHYRGNGKPFVAHLVGVASVLAAHDRPIETVAAGLLHSVYELGEFGDGTRGISARKQQQVRLAVGDAVETLVAGYSATRWQFTTIADMTDRAANLPPAQLLVIEIKLADAIDDHLDGGLAYAPGKKLAAAGENHEWAAALVRLAHAAGRPQLAAQLEAVAAIDPQVPACLLHARGESFVVAPLSHRERIVNVVSRKFARRWPGNRRVA